VTILAQKKVEKIDHLSDSIYNGYMPFQHLNKDDPLSLTLAADYRFSQPAYTNDQIWELRLQGGEPPAVVLQTTFGLRARWMRIFPRFIRKNKTYSDPSQFHIPPQIQRNYPNFIHLTCAPYSGLEVHIEYFAISSQAVACRTRLRNTTILKDTLSLEWAALLSPIEEGSGMQPVSTAPCRLIGHTADLEPVLIVEDCTSVGKGSYPTLNIDLELYPGSVHTCTWASAALEGEAQSLEAAQDALKTLWEKQSARIELQNSSQMVEIHTGREDWDNALTLSQTVAAGLILPGEDTLPNPTFVLTRLPDQGFSFRGDGSDYSYLWKGQTVLDAFYLASLVLPGRFDLVKGIIENFISTQKEDGRIDWRPNLAGQRSRYLAQPVLATLVWQASGYLSDPSEWLTRLYPALLKFFRAWFTHGMDSDQDGFPEWEHAQQTGLEDLPIYNLWHPNTRGIDIHMLEAPALAAFLYREGQSLMQIAQMIGRDEDQAWLDETIARIQHELEKSWHAKSGLYRYRDTQSHAIQEGGLLKNWRGSGKFAFRRTFKIPQRLLVTLAPFEENTRAITVKLLGTSEEGDILEEINPRGWTWVANQAHFSSQMLFRTLTGIEISGADPNDVTSLARVNHMQEDASLFLPLWAQMISPAQAKKMVDGWLLTAFQHPYGMPISIVEQFPANPPSLNGVSPLWVHLVGQGLLAYGYRAEAMDLISHTMDAICGSLRRFTSFREYYDADTGQAIGERNHLRGLPPLGLFLQLIGIEKLTPKEILIKNFNPFPSQVTVKYRSTIIVCHANETVVTFSNGQTARVSGAGQHRITID
jgi:hypothetical protein